MPPKTGHTSLTFLAQLGIPAPHVANLSAYACKPWVPATDRMNLAREVIPQKSLTMGMVESILHLKNSTRHMFQVAIQRVGNIFDVQTSDKQDVFFSEMLHKKGSTSGLPVRVPISHCHTCHPDLGAMQNCQVTMGRPLVFRALVQGFVKSSTYHSILWWICRHHKLIFSAFLSCMERCKENGPNNCSVFSNFWISFQILAPMSSNPCDQSNL